MKKLLMTAAALAAMTGSAFAQSSPCGAYDLTAQHLVDVRGEVKMLVLDTNSSTSETIDHAEFWINVETGSFTYLFVHVENNFTCIGDRGESSEAASRDDTPAPTPEGEEG